MPELKLVEESPERIVLKMSALHFLGQMALCIFFLLAICTSLTFVLRHYFGVMAFVLVTIPGVICVACGFIGCANAREFTFTFDREQNEFTAAAGRARFVRAFRDVLLVHIEQEIGSGGVLGSEAPAYALTLFFSDGTRFRLEAGISISGRGPVPTFLEEYGEKLRHFLRLPQQTVPLLNIHKNSEEKPSDQETEACLSNWLSCQGLAPRASPALYEYDWVEPPVGVVLPPPRPRPLGFQSYSQQSYQQAYIQPAANRRSQFGDAGPVVVGRPVGQPQTLTAQIVVPEGASGQTITVMTPDGTQLNVTVPSDMRPGETMSVQYVAPV
eukprot:TRINITY_DN80137_c0_g1_i1.p1 TRINITY_DN80137_c0_g1~~TRINITY_DN80137_c0_g1_i1.p1  ORF type:complete len:327 (+),score=39.49 TRINITY_DN80137_c0_g1_i1:46-1026(+)